MCGFPADSIIAFRDPGFIHDGLLTDLQPATLYFYSFGSPKVCQIKFLWNLFGCKAKRSMYKIIF